MPRRVYPSLPEVIRQIVVKDLVIYESIQMKIVNYHALAARIKPLVEERIGQPVLLSTLVVAITRVAEAERQAPTTPPQDILKKAKLELSSGITQLSVDVSAADFGALLSKLQKAMPSDKTVLVHLVHPNIYFVGDSAALEQIAGGFLRDQGFLRASELAELRIRLPPEAADTPGIVAYISSLLYRHGVSIISGFLSSDQVRLIVEERDAPRAFESLRGLVPA